MTENQLQVMSWNEWDPLKRVIVGRADGTMVQAPEPAISRDWQDHGFPRGSFGPIPSDMVHVANEQLDALAHLLESRGILVDRPRPLDFHQAVSTPEWVQQTMFGCAAPRDLLLIAGRELLEASMSYRSRWFEYLAYRPLIETYYLNDPRMRWESAPKPRLTNASYNLTFWDDYPGLPLHDQIARLRNNAMILTEAEPLFDAADITRAGKELFVQRSLVTNATGIRWLKDHFPAYRVHEVVFDCAYPLHLDATWVFLRPGMVLHCPKRPAAPEVIAYFLQNDWQIIPAGTPAHTWSSLPPLCYCSPWLSMNILMLDSRTVCVEESEVAQADQLSALGFNVLPVPFWAVAPFGGGLHCATLDVCREGVLEDYFSNPRTTHQHIQ